MLVPRSPTQTSHVVSARYVGCRLRLFSEMSYVTTLDQGGAGYIQSTRYVVLPTQPPQPSIDHRTDCSCEQRTKEHEVFEKYTGRKKKGKLQNRNTTPNSSKTKTITEKRNPKPNHTIQLKQPDIPKVKENSEPQK